MATHNYGNGTNSTSGANTIIHFYDRAGIKAANRVNVFQQFADKKSMPTKYGKTFKISKFLHLYDRALSDADFAKKGYLTARTADAITASLASAGLAEGAGAVNKRTLQKITVETTLSRYGEMIDYTDEVDLFSEDVIQTRYREELGALANSRYEDLIMMDMLGTPTVQYAGAATSLITVGGGIAANGTQDDVYKVSYDLIRKAARRLLRNRAKKNTEIVSGSVKIDTKTVAKAYYAIVGADVKSDLENLTRGNTYEREFVYIPVHKYAAAGNLAEGEVGAMHEARFVEAEGMAVYAGKGAVPPQNYVGTLSITGATDLTSATPSARGNFDVFPILFPTQGAFATVGLKGQDKIVFHSKPPSDVSNTNPYGTSGFFSYNFFYAGLILEEEKLLKTLVAASA
jgi:N4-gp56 family major capsid protein